MSFDIFRVKKDVLRGKRGLLSLGAAFVKTNSLLRVSRERKKMAESNGFITKIKGGNEREK